MIRILLIAVLSVVTIFSANAQAIASTAQAPADRISVSLNSTPLPDAIWTIARRSGIQITFNRSKLPAKLVTYRAEGVTPEAAFAAVLSGTGFKANKVPNGTFELVRLASGKGSLSQGVIAGKVTDAKTGKGMSGANVSVGADNRGAVTGEDGSYRLAGVAAGTHTVSVRLLGYAKQTRAVTVGDGATVSADFKLEQTANVLDQVVVTGTVVSTELKAVPNAITIVTAKQIEERGITRIDQLFRGDIPGLFSSNIGNSGVSPILMFSRGATALTLESSGTSNGTNPIKTYVDGVELANPGFLNQIDPKSIERIEILTGPQASTIYGSNALNGVMQIFTKRGSAGKPQFTLNWMGGWIQNNFSSSLAPNHVTDARLSGTEGKWSYNVGGAWNYIAPWSPTAQEQSLGWNGGGRMDLGKLTADASARYNTVKNRHFGSTTQYIDDRVDEGIEYLGRSRRSNLRVGTTARTAGLTLGYRPFASWSHELVLGIDESTGENISPVGKHITPGDSGISIHEISASSRKSERYTTTLQIPVSGLAHLNLTVGGDHWRSTRTFWTASNIVSTTGSIPNVSLERTHPSKNSGAFVQGQLALKDALFFTYGLRADWNPTMGEDAKVLPGRYGVSYVRDIGPVSAKLRGSYGRSTRPPTDGFRKGEPQCGLLGFACFELRKSNPDLASEHQQGGEGGLELYFGSRGSLVVTRYNQTVDGLILLVPKVDSAKSLYLFGTPELPSCTPLSTRTPGADGYCYRFQRQFINVGAIRNQGWELQGSANVGPLTTRGTYSWTKSRVIGVTPRYKTLLAAGFISFQAGAPFRALAEHTWALGVTYARSASTVALNVNGVGALYRFSDELKMAVAPFSVRFTTVGIPRMELPDNYSSVGSGYATADMNASHRFTSRLDGVLQINNLTNYFRNDFTFEVPVIGRQTKLGFRFRQ